MPIGSYFSWGRRARSRAATPRLDEDCVINPVDITPPQQQLSPIVVKLEAAPKNAPSKHTGSLSRARPVPPPSLRTQKGLDETLEYVWLEDNLRRTDRRLNTCSLQLDAMSTSAAQIRRDLEDLQKSLASVSKRRPRSAIQIKAQEIRAIATIEASPPAGVSSPEIPQAEPLASAVNHAFAGAALTTNTPQLQPTLSLEPETCQVPVEAVSTEKLETEEVVAEHEAYTTTPPLSPLSPRTLVETPSEPDKRASVEILLPKTYVETKTSKPKPKPKSDIRPQHIDVKPRAIDSTALESPLSKLSWPTPLPTPTEQPTTTERRLGHQVSPSVTLSHKEQLAPRSLASIVADRHQILTPPATPQRRAPEFMPQTPLSMKSSTAQPQPSLESSKAPNLDNLYHQRTPRSMRPTNVVQRLPLKLVPDKAPMEQKGTPAVRPTVVQRRFPRTGGAPPPVNAAHEAMVRNRASLKPVMGSNKVSQMAQFWSQMDGK